VRRRTVYATAVEHFPIGLAKKDHAQRAGKGYAIDICGMTDECTRRPQPDVKSRWFHRFLER